MPQSLEEISKWFLPYSTILIRIRIDQHGNLESQQVGSGTYVTTGQIHGILTAQHCIEALNGDYRLGLTSGRENVEHRILVEKKSIGIVEVARRETEEYGPDLGLIILSDSEKVGTIKATNSFYNLSTDRDRMLNDPPLVRESIWYYCGVPNERMIQGKSTVGFDKLLEFQMFCGAAGVDRYYEKDGYDYFETDIDRDDRIPRGFGGMSGGRLWQVPVEVVDLNSYVPIDHFLSGVIFYEGRGEGTKRYLRCHGRRSIYRHIFEKLNLF